MTEFGQSLFGNDATSPGKQIRLLLDERGWTQDDLATITGRSRQQIVDLVSGRRGITTEMAIALAAAFGTNPTFWLNLDTSYRLASTPADPTKISSRARMFTIAPIREMQKRGWISGKSVDEVEAEVKAFFGVDSFDEEPRINVATRKSDSGEDLTPKQRAWCYRVRQLGRAQLVAEFRDEALPRCAQELRKIAMYPQEAHKIPQVLASFGIRFVAVEPMPSTKVDGVALWLDPVSPVIGMSLHHDRVDYFWFTLFHELEHIRHRDEAPLDAELGDPMAGVMMVKSEIERRANDGAANILIPKSEMDSFILRVGPQYGKDRIVQFAHRIKTHPGIVVGQLQRRGEIGWSANREMLSKIRQTIVPAAITDGWGNAIDPRSLA